MNKYCVIPEEVRFDIEMELYFRYNDRLSNMYDHLEYYSLKDIRELEKIEKEEINKIHYYLYGGNND